MFVARSAVFRVVDAKISRWNFDGGDLARLDDGDLAHCAMYLRTFFKQNESLLAVYTHVIS